MDKSLRAKAWMQKPGCKSLDTHGKSLDTQI